MGSVQFNAPQHHLLSAQLSVNSALMLSLTVCHVLLHLVLPAHHPIHSSMDSVLFHAQQDMLLSELHVNLAELPVLLAKT